MNACAFLSHLGAAAQPAAAFALSVLQSTSFSYETRGNAAVVLASGRADSLDIRAALLEAVKLEDVRAKRLRIECALALWGLDRQYAPMGTRLVLKSIVPSNKQSLAGEPDFIGWLNLRHVDPYESIPTLKQSLESDSAEIRKEATEALEKIKAQSKAGEQQ